MLHGRAPVRLQLRGTPEHPRFEVHDCSPIAPQRDSSSESLDLNSLGLGLDGEEIGIADFDEEQLSSLLTVGRGLDIVARASRAWGADIEEDGKTVWFEPATELQDGPGADYQLSHDSTGDVDVRTRAGQIAVQINSVPVEAFTRFQRHFRDLRREIRLLALAHQSDYPLAKVLSEHFDALETPLRANMGREQVEAAREAGQDDLDLRLRMTAEVARRIGGLIDLLDASDEFSRANRLLTAARTDEQRAFQIWFLGEFRRQAAGAPPVAWGGLSGAATQP